MGLLESTGQGVFAQESRNPYEEIKCNCDGGGWGSSQYRMPPSPLVSLLFTVNLPV